VHIPCVLFAGDKQPLTGVLERMSRMGLRARCHGSSAEIRSGSPAESVVKERGGKQFSVEIPIGVFCDGMPLGVQVCGVNMTVVKEKGGE